MQQGEGIAENLLPIVAAAHELKAPLALVRQLALSIEPGSSTAEVEQIVERIKLTSERAIRLTTDLTKASRLQPRLFELEPVNPYELCKEVVQELEPLFKARNTGISVKPSRRNILAIANRDLLRRVLTNFSDNALEYARGSSAVEFSVQQRGMSIRLSVRDYGPSVSKQLWRQLEEGIGKKVQPVQDRPGSSGLGLYLSGYFAEIMNGRIGVVSHKDGASFYVDLQASTQLSLL